VDTASSLNLITLLNHLGISRGLYLLPLLMLLKRVLNDRDALHFGERRAVCSTREETSLIDTEVGAGFPRSH